MNEKIFFWGMRFFMVLGLGGLLAVLVLLSPYEGQGIGEGNKANIILFYLASAVFLASFFSFLLLKMRMKFDAEQEQKDAHIGVSLRQGILLAIMVIAILVLQSFRVLTWWDGLLVIAAVLMVELYYLSR